METSLKCMHNDRPNDKCRLFVIDMIEQIDYYHYDYDGRGQEREREVGC